jgi:hypothetical protein
VTRPGQPRPRLIEVCKRCGQPYVLLSVEGWCPHCAGSRARAELALEGGAAGRTAPVVDAALRDWSSQPD